MMNGQACSATKRIIVQESLHDELVDRWRRAQVVGPARERRDHSRTADQQAAPRAGRSPGRGMRFPREGCRQRGSDADGAYFSADRARGVPADAAVARDEEIFGPVFSVIPVP